MNDAIITFIGAGNMANCLIGGLINNGYKAKNICATSPDPNHLQEMENKWKINTTLNNAEGAKQADVIIFAVKPQVIKEVALELAPILSTKKTLVISIVAGVTIQQYQSWLGTDLAIVRCMPNTPALIGYGATVLLANHIASPSDKKIAQTIFSNVGMTEWIRDEKLMDIVTSVSGSGPAYFFSVMEALEQATIQMGLDAKLSHALIIQTALGSAFMALNSKLDIASLRQQVTSPGGGTEQALKVFEKNNLNKIFTEALEAARNKYTELSKEMDK